MTAEIAICNANGIALAADSAVSMGDGNKVYNTANKLFSLSKYHPVAVMVYNNASLLGVPWETIIKMYREELGQRSFPELRGYVDDFWQFTQSKNEWFPESLASQFVRLRIDGFVAELTDQFVASMTESEIDPDDDAGIRDTLDQVVSRFGSLFDRLGLLDGFEDNDVEAASVKYHDLAKQSLQDNLENSFNLLTEEQKTSLLHLCARCLTANHFDHYSGVVFAGFGVEEILPKIATYKAGIFINGKLRLQPDATLSNLDHQDFAPAIYPYAQDDVVRSFIDGVDPELDAFVVNLLGNLDSIVKLFPADAIAGLSDQERGHSIERVRDKIREISGQLGESYETAKFDLGRNKLLEMLSVLPKDELAEMAESLVSLTAFKRRMTADKESVGGPIDVAILSKGDGFIWIKRKHYFKPELNQHFFHNYFKG